ncbi:MAG: hypothetical protein HYR64_05610 [Fimbriimonas ginsengisoli]|uniref:DUF3466 family protein n=1 Tax=Fimbriimonas ginsengisoli TaxID=1005039 RepID=A0A931M0B7_FIMGI|nr:hypothetical protein [Fimbriimonas ginsengisoli]
MLPAAMLVATVLAGPRYTAVEIKGLPGFEELRQEACLTDSGFVVGVGFGPDANGDFRRQRPFIWREGKTLALPLPAPADFLIQFSGRGNVIAATALHLTWKSKDRSPVGPFLVVWNADRTQGLGKPSVSRLKYPVGPVSIARDGSVWLSYGPWILRKTPEGAGEIMSGGLETSNSEFVLQGTDVGGDLFGMLRGSDGKEPVARVGGIWYFLHPNGYRGSKVNALNAEGVCVGEVEKARDKIVWYQETEAAVWGTDLQFRSLAGPGELASTAYAINDHGDIVGSFLHPDENDFHACPWTGGHREDLFQVVSGVDLLYADQINNRGQILAWGERGDHLPHLFLLSPAKAS